MGAGGKGVIGESSRVPKHTEQLLPLPQNQTDPLELSIGRWPAVFRDKVTLQVQNLVTVHSSRLSRTKPRRSPFKCGDFLTFKVQCVIFGDFRRLQHQVVAS